MPPKPSSSPSPSAAPRALILLVLAVTLGLGGWWLRRSAVDARLAREVAAMAPATLPSRDMAIDSGLASLGAELFRRHCSACHAVTGDTRVGPNLAGVTTRRPLSWIVAMILRPDSMTREDADARALKTAFGVQMMVPGDFGPGHARAVVEFLRRVDAR